MAQFTAEYFADQTILVDGHDYDSCMFERCALVYGGGNLPNLTRCRIMNSRWEFSDAAQRTLGLLGRLYHGMGPGGRDLVEQTFDQLRQWNTEPQEQAGGVAEEAAVSAA